MIVDCGERMLPMLQIAQRRLQVLSDPRARLLSHTDAAALVICSDNRRADPERCLSMRRTRSPYCARHYRPRRRPNPRMNSRRCSLKNLVGGVRAVLRKSPRSATKTRQVHPLPTRATSRLATVGGPDLMRRSGYALFTPPSGRWLSPASTTWFPRDQYRPRIPRA
jgi:hypothetical protein